MLAACQSGVVSEKAEQTSAYEAAADSTKFSNDITALNSPSRKRVRTADVRCRVDNAFKSALLLEQAVAGMNGVVVESSLHNSFGNQRDLPYSSDSLKRVQLYTPTAYLTLHVPAAGLDSIVLVLTNMASFIDHRTLKTADKTLDYLSNSLKNHDSGAVKIVPGKQGTAVDVAMYQDNKREVAIDRKIANLVIMDSVNYATFTVQLFQPEMADVQIVVNPDDITRAGFGTELLSAFGTGVDALRNVILFLLQLWPFWLLAGAVLWWYKRRPAPVKG
jgi:hypothetical protein